MRFPKGTAALETLMQVYSHGQEAVRRLTVLSTAGLLASALKRIDDFYWRLPRWSTNPSLERLTSVLDSSLLLLGFGDIIDLCVGLSLLFGAIVARAGIASWLVVLGLVILPVGSSRPQFSALIARLLWPGDSLMVCATSSSLGLSMLKDSRMVTHEMKPVLHKPSVTPGIALSGRRRCRSMY